MREGTETISLLAILLLLAAATALVIFVASNVFGGAESGALEILDGVGDWDLGIGSADGDG